MNINTRVLLDHFFQKGGIVVSTCMYCSFLFTHMMAPLPLVWGITPLGYMIRVPPRPSILVPAVVHTTTFVTMLYH